MEAKVIEMELSSFSKNFGQLISRAERGYRLFMDEQMRPFGLNGRAPMLISYLDRHPGSSQDALAAHCVLDKCTVARSAGRLEQLGYITRQVNPNDKRQYDLHLTEKGSELLSKIRGFQNEWSRRFDGVLTEKEQETVITLLEKLL